MLNRNRGRSFSKAVDANKLRRLGVDDSTSEEVFEKPACFDDEDCFVNEPLPDEDWKKYVDSEGKYVGAPFTVVDDDDYGSPDPDDEWIFEASKETGINHILMLFAPYEKVTDQKLKNMEQTRKTSSAWEEYLKEMSS